MDRKVFLKNFIFAAASMPALGLFTLKSAPVAKELILRDGSLMTYCTATDSAYITRQIARYNKKWIEALDQRIFEILSQKIETQYA